MSKTISKMNLIAVVQQLPKEDVEIIQSYIEMLEDEIENLSKQIDYLRSGEYLNQLKFERDMLQHVVDNSEVSKEDKNFIDMTHRNTELLAQQKEFIEWLEQCIENEKYCYLSPHGNERYRQDFFIEVLSKYKEIIGV